MNHQIQLIVELPDDALAETADASHDVAFDRAEWRIDRAEKKRADEADARQRLSDDPGMEGVEVEEDIGELGHGY
jgi:hypothetical protein